MARIRIRTACLALVTAAAVAGLGACQSSGAAKAGSADNAGASAGANASGGTTGAEALAAVGRSTAGYRSVHMKAVNSVGATRTTIEGRMSWNPLAEDVTTSVPGLDGSGGMRMLLSGTTAWARIGGRWTKLDMAKVLGGGSSDSQDPSSMVQLLVNSGDVKKVGQETVDGVPTTHWAGTVDVQRVAARSGLPAGVKKMLAVAARQGLTNERVDLWANAEDLPVRVHTSARTKQGEAVSTIDYTGYSTTPVKVTPPTAG